MRLCTTAELLEAASDTDPKCRALVEEELVRRYQPMTRRQVRRFAGRGAEADDLLQVANLALINAIRGFDPCRGCFDAYAKATISGEMKRHLRDHCWAVRPPRRVQELQAQITLSSEEMAQRDGTLPTTCALAQYMDASVTDITEALAARRGYTTCSLDDLLGEAGRPLSQILSTEVDPYDEILARVSVDQICGDLLDDDRELIRLRFTECLSQREIAEEIGVSQMQVSRLLVRLMDRLRGRALPARVA